tara:strand:- start:342 stop:554 length:213 start_codon:yes stop_codon:yes gene_type:complete
VEKLTAGDLIVTLPKVEQIKAITMNLTRGMIGVVVDHSARFNHVVVYGVSIDGRVYYLFEDEIKKLEKEC